jgi:hypothetical protein
MAQVQDFRQMDGRLTVGLVQSFATDGTVTKNIRTRATSLFSKSVEAPCGIIHDVFDRIGQLTEAGIRPSLVTLTCEVKTTFTANTAFVCRHHVSVLVLP